jgi:hypothetical protein
VITLAAYAVIAFELEGQQRRPVLPTFRGRLGAAAVREGLVTQVDGLANEAGVRRTT